MCEEKAITGKRRKTPKFSDESEVYEVVCSNQKIPHSLKGCFLPLSEKYFIRGSEERAQILTPPLPLHPLVCTLLTHHAHKSLPGLIWPVSIQCKDSYVQNPTEGMLQCAVLKYMHGLAVALSQAWFAHLNPCSVYSLISFWED